MQSLLSGFENATNGARFAVNSTTYVGKMFTRIVGSSLRGRCIVCNNLSPEGHEKTFGRERGFFQLSDSEAIVAGRRQLADVPTLMIEDINVAEILMCREKNEDGKLKRQCGYCDILCIILDTLFPDWASRQDRAFDKINLMIQDRSPLVLSYRRRELNAALAYNRFDIEIYRPLDQTSTPTNDDRLLAWPSLGYAKENSDNAGSEHCFEFLEESFHECTMSHPLCARPDDKFVPTRLLFIGSISGVSAVKLCDPVDTTESVKWAALSHCWGGEHPLSLTTSTIKQRKSGVSIDELPATFRDAIQVARHLKIQYIWIDSLCIIQDSPEDWRIEAATMGKIYQNASIVIVAASSPNPHTSFLGPRSSEWLSKPMRFSRKDGSEGKVRFRQRPTLASPLEQGGNEPPFTMSWATLKRIGPLYSRAWCFQETFLATRALHFTPGAIIFECKTHQRSESQSPPYISTIEGTFGTVTEEEKWEYIVKSYSSLSLTYNKDKLPAISGIATLVGSKKKDQYLAGLWQSSLLESLLWHPINGASTSVLTSASYIAPSWSWASINRGIAWNAIREPKFLATILEARCVTAVQSPYGEVLAGRIVLRGRLAPVMISSPSTNTDYEVYYLSRNGKKSSKKWFNSDGRLAEYEFITRSGGKEKSVRRAKHGDEFPASDMPAWFFCVAETSWVNYGTIGLLLGLSEMEDGAYERLACVSNLSKDWYKIGKEITISIL